MKKLSQNNQAVSAIIIVIIIFLIISCVLVFQYLATHQTVECGPGETVKITGYLYGFYPTEEEPFILVKIGDQNLTFKHWDHDYMSNLLGENVTLVCCYRNNTFSPDSYYDLRYAHIEGE